MDWKRASNRRKAAELDFLGVPHSFKPSAPRKASGLPLEADTLKAVGELLCLHRRVLLAVRANSGAASYEAASGRHQPVWFYKILAPRAAITITDYWGLLYDQELQIARFFAIECKRPGWRFQPSDERAQRQHRFILLAQEHGGLGGFVTNVDEAKALLDQFG